jgi:hypothetical protein
VWGFATDARGDDLETSLSTAGEENAAMAMRWGGLGVSP